MSLYALIKPRGPSGFGAGSTAEEVTRGRIDFLVEYLATIQRP